MKKLFLYLFFILLSNQLFETFAQFPLQVGNRWDYTDCWWNPIPQWDCDTTVHYVVADTLFPNGKTYYMIRPMNYYFFKDYMRADSIGIYYYDTLCNKEWLYFDYNLRVGDYVNVGQFWYCDTTNLPKVYKTLDTITVFFEDTVRMMIFYYNEGLDNDYRVTVIPEFGFVEWDQYGFFANYNINLKGCILSGVTYGILTSVQDEITLPNYFSLSQNFPNPFNPSTIIQYEISSRQFIVLKVYDVLGNEVATLVNEEKEPGTYKVEFKLENNKLSSAVYFYRLKTGSYGQTKKMLLLR